MAPKKEDFYDLLSIDLETFWKTHYTFTSVSKKSSKKLTKQFKDLLLINAIVPLKLLYLKQKGEDYHDKILGLVQQVASEKNSIISKFKELKIISNNAIESQALLELKNSYCTKKRCLHCAIGNNILKKE